MANAETFEVGVIQSYMPAQLSTAEIDALVQTGITEAGATGPKDMGKVIGWIKPKVAGRADMGKLSEIIKNKLAALS